MKVKRISGGRRLEFRASEISFKSAQEKLSDDAMISIVCLFFCYTQQSMYISWNCNNKLLEWRRWKRLRRIRRRRSKSEIMLNQRPKTMQLNMECEEEERNKNFLWTLWVLKNLCCLRTVWLWTYKYSPQGLKTRWPFSLDSYRREESHSSKVEEGTWKRCAMCWSVGLNWTKGNLKDMWGL